MDEKTFKAQFVANWLAIAMVNHEHANRQGGSIPPIRKEGVIDRLELIYSYADTAWEGIKGFEKQLDPAQPNPHDFWEYE